MMENSVVKSTFMECIDNIPMVYSRQVFPLIACQKIKENSAGTYNHHASVIHYNGSLRVIWSSHEKDEDGIGQNVMYSSSKDFYNWSEPRVLAKAWQGKEFTVTLTAAGFHSYNDKLVVYIAKYEVLSDGDKRGYPELYYMESDDGEVFSPLRSLNCPVCPNHGPEYTASGRLLISGNRCFPYSDNKEGTGRFELSSFINPDEMPEPPFDKPSSEQIKKMSHYIGSNSNLCEGSWYQTDDGVIHMLLRSRESFLYETVSLDDAVSWSPPRKTNFPDADTKFHFGRLPDGRFYYVGNPVPKSNRIPLAISVSDDGICFDKHFILGNTTYKLRVPGKSKGGIYGYPHSYIHGECLYVVCSIYKEDITVFEVKLRDLK